MYTAAFLLNCVSIDQHLLMLDIKDPGPLAYEFSHIPQ